MTEDDWLKIIMFIKRYISENYPQKGKPNVTIENFTQTNTNVSTINQVMTGNIDSTSTEKDDACLEEDESCDSWMKKYDPLTRSMLVDFQKMEHKKKLKVFAFIAYLFYSI